MSEAKKTNNNICNGCGAENPESSKFCVECGQKIEPEVKIIDTNEKKSEEQEENFNPKTELIFIGITAFIYIL